LDVSPCGVPAALAAVARSRWRRAAARGAFPRLAQSREYYAQAILNGVRRSAAHLSLARQRARVEECNGAQFYSCRRRARSRPDDVDGDADAATDRATSRNGTAHSAGFASRRSRALADRGDAGILRRRQASCRVGPRLQPEDAV